MVNCGARAYCNQLGTLMCLMSYYENTITRGGGSAGQGESTIVLTVWNKYTVIDF